MGNPNIKQHYTILWCFYWLVGHLLFIHAYLKLRNKSHNAINKDIKNSSTIDTFGHGHEFIFLDIKKMVAFLSSVL